MKAAVLYGREDVRVEQVEVPPLEAGDILLRTRVALTCGTDAKVFRRGYHARMIVPPAVFGHEMAGIVEEVAPGVDGLRAGHGRRRRQLGAVRRLLLLPSRDAEPL
jgi:L-iditol 2-dehydrogenase